MNFGTSKKIVLDLYQNKYVATNAAQYDIDSRELIVQITDEGKPYYVDKETVKVVLKYKKSDGHNVINDCVVLEDGTVQVELTDQMLVTGGRCEAELMLLNIETQEAIHTMTFVVNTKDSVLTNEDINSTNEFKTLERALLQVEDVGKYADSARESAEMAEQYEEAALQAKKSAEAIMSQIEDVSSYVDDTKEYASEALASKNNIVSYEQEALEATNKISGYKEDALEAKNNIDTYLQDATTSTNTIQGYVDDANETITNANTMIDSLEQTITEIESNEDTRVQSEIDRVDAENTRISNEALRQTQETERQTDAATAIASANQAAQRANIAAESCESIVEGTGLIASTEKGKAEGVATLDSNAKIPMEQLADEVVTQSELDAAYANSNLYTDTKISELINGAPETLNTLKEISDAIAEHQEVTDALNDAIGSKANQTELDTHTSNTTIHITASERTNWNDANTKKHTHSNQTVLDATTASYTQTEKDKLAGISDSADAVSFTQSLTSGTQIGTININGSDTKLYAPTSTTYGVATTSANGLMSSDDKVKLDCTNITFGTCSTDASTGTKVVNITGNTNWSLQMGAVIYVYYNSTNTSNIPKLNVNGTGEKLIVVNGSVASGSAYITYGGIAGHIYKYIYNGTSYIFAGSSVLDSSTLGSSTTPVYLSGGKPVSCSTYAGGTKVTLNGTAKGASTASFYAPTTAGTSGYVLTSNGSGAPTWANPEDTAVKVGYLYFSQEVEASTYVAIPLSEMTDPLVVPSRFLACIPTLIGASVDLHKATVSNETADANCQIRLTNSNTKAQKLFVGVTYFYI